MGSERESRVDAIAEKIGVPERAFSHGAFLESLFRVTRREFRLHVEPLVTLHCPELRGTPFYGKLHTVATGFFACAPYFSVILSDRRPWLLRRLTRVSSLLGLESGAISRGLACLLPWYARLRLGREGRRIILGASLIAVVDEVLDRQLASIPPDRRCTLLREALDGAAEPSTPGLALLRALRLTLEGASPGQSREIAEIMEGCHAWAEAEMARLQGLPDPEGIAHRGMGISMGTKGMAWTVGRFIGPGEGAWIADVGRLMQMLDDWVDLETDLAAGVQTPVAEGVWTLDAIRDQFDRTRQDLVRLAEQNGERYGPYLELLRASYTEQIRRLLQLMREGVIA